MKNPIVFLIFNRPELTAKVFEAIRQVQPPLLFVVADGPRPDRANEASKCQQTRAVLNGVDWNCQVLTNYSEVNLGCAKRVSSGLNWVFEQVESAIILEDDCFPHPTFFRYCEELLEYYQHEERVMSIAGTNFQFGQKKTQYSYYYSGFHDCWGWATWRRAWQYFDFEMKLWPQLRDQGFLAQKLPHKRAVQYWTEEFQDTYDGRINSWFYRWLLSCWVQQGLGIRPQVNLVSNLGFSVTDSSNTLVEASKVPYASMQIKEISFPLQHPPEIQQDYQADKITQDNRYSPNLLTRLRHKIKKFSFS